MGNDSLVNKCHINKGKKTFVISCTGDDGKEENSFVDFKNLNLRTEKDRYFINNANRCYMSDVYKQDGGEGERDGFLPYPCLNPACLNDNDPIKDVIISPKYITNAFINLINLLSNDNDAMIFNRNKNVIIPASDGMMQEMMEKMFEKHANTIPQFNNDDEVNNQLGFFISIFINQMKKLQEDMSKKMKNLQNNQRNIKIANIMGGINLQNNNDKKTDFMFGDFISSIGEVREQIHAFIRENKSDIIKECFRAKNDNDNALKQVFELINAYPNTPIYFNHEITYPLMFKTLGQVFEIIFLKIIPRLSMTLSIIGSIYYATFLYEMNLLEAFGYSLQMPIILRMIYSCYPEASNVNDDLSEIYLKKNYENIYDNIQNIDNNCIVVNDVNDENKESDNLNFIMKIAMKFEIENKEFSNHLYNVLNSKRQRTYEYYIIAILGLYMNGIAKTMNLNRRNRESNGKNFIEPIHRVMTKFYQCCNYTGIREELIDVAGYINYQYVNDFLNIFNQNCSDLLNECMVKTISTVGNIIGERKMDVDL